MCVSGAGMGGSPCSLRGRVASGVEGVTRRESAPRRPDVDQAGWTSPPSKPVSSTRAQRFVRRSPPYTRAVIDAVVRTDMGHVRGLDQAGIISFRGIPFAAPPEGP